MTNKILILPVLCDMSTDGGGWIVLQRNKKDSRVNFHRTWAEYEKGFGDLYTEFWYGLQEIHYLTKSSQWEMRVDYQDNNKLWHYINQFSVGSASQEYPLTVGGFTREGTDYWFNEQSNRQHYQLNGMRFSTQDNDNDKSGGNCAVDYRSGWWYNNCALLNMNHQPPLISAAGPNSNRAVLFTEMKIRPKDCKKQ